MQAGTLRPDAALLAIVAPDIAAWSDASAPIPPFLNWVARNCSRHFPVRIHLPPALAVVHAVTRRVDCIACTCRPGSVAGAAIFPTVGGARTAARQFRRSRSRRFDGGAQRRDRRLHVRPAGVVRCAGGIGCEATRSKFFANVGWSHLRLCCRFRIQYVDDIIVVFAEGPDIDFADKRKQHRCRCIRRVDFSDSTVAAASIWHPRDRISAACQR